MENSYCVGRLQDFPVGKPRLIQVGPQPVFILNRGENFVAFDDYCPHRAGPLSEGACDGSTIECPWHGARFDLSTGKPLSGPCRRALRLRTLTVESDQVFVS